MSVLRVINCRCTNQPVTMEPVTVPKYRYLVSSDNHLTPPLLRMGMHSYAGPVGGLQAPVTCLRTQHSLVLYVLRYFGNMNTINTSLSVVSINHYGLCLQKYILRRRHY